MVGAYSEPHAANAQVNRYFGVRPAWGVLRYTNAAAGAGWGNNAHPARRYRAWLVGRTPMRHCRKAFERKESHGKGRRGSASEEIAESQRPGVGPGNSGDKTMIQRLVQSGFETHQLATNGPDGQQRPVWPSRASGEKALRARPHTTAD